MDLRVTVVDPTRTGASVDLSINAPVGTPLSAVAAELAGELGLPGPAEGAGRPTASIQFRCGRTVVADHLALGLPPLLRGAVLTLSPDRPDGGTVAASEPAVLEAHVVAGPDAGSVVPLAAGRHSIGRAGSNSVRLTDPDVSRAHAELIVTASQIEVRDADSMNGTWLGGRQLGQRCEVLGIDEPVTIGSSTLAVRLPDRPPAVTTVDGEGHLMVNRSPRLPALRVRAEISFPTPTTSRSATRLPWPALLLPLLIAVPMAVFWRQPTFLAFALMTPILALGQFFADHRSGRREAADLRARYGATSKESEASLVLAVATDAAYLEAARPDLARLAVTARTPTDELWRRSNADPDFLVLRLGRGAEASQVTAQRPPSPERVVGPDRGPEVIVHPDVPLGVNLCEVQILGVCGPRPTVLGLARSLIGQASVLHSPDELRIEVVTADPEHRRDWRWVTWLPHHRPAAQALPSPKPEPGRPRRVIVLDGAHLLRRRPAVAAILNEAGRIRVELGDRGQGSHPPLVICLDRTEQNLPVECRALITLDPTPVAITDRELNPGPGAIGPGQVAARTATFQRPAAPSVRFAPDLASCRWAEQICRHLAPLRDATADLTRSVPARVNLVDLLANDDGVMATDPIDLARHWRRTGRTEPTATIGSGSEGVFRIDLRRDGPHALVGGTTGAGKSELLQTMVAALAVGCAPDAVSFLLIDYKGAAAFRECAALPHVGGVISDLDPHLARRALTSLTAELRRRERLLAGIAAPDIDAYAATRSARPDLTALPRLVVIVDEFRVLAEELPEFVGGLIRTATVGRSLGVHLVLATQRPAGIVSPEIAANVNLRIALRVRDGADSRDLVDEPAAALLPAEFPGRALARSGAGPLITFQTARVSGRTRPVFTERPVVRRVDQEGEGACGRAAAAPEGSEGSDGRSESETAQERSDLAAIAAAARSAARQLDLAPVSPPWLPPLDDTVALDSLIALDNELAGNAEEVAAAGQLGRTRIQAQKPQTPLRVPFALADLPAEQHQFPLVWRLARTHLAVVGGPRSGRSTALRTIAHAAEAVLTADRGLHLYVIDGSGSQTGLERIPHVDAVVAVHDIERAERLLRRVRTEIDARLGATGTGRSANRVEASAVVVLIDGWEALTTSWAEIDHGRMLDQLMSILRDGTAVGVHVAISGGRSLLTGAVSSLLAERVVLRFADATDSLLAGINSRQLGKQPAGRGIHLGPDDPGGTEIQVAVARPEPVEPRADATKPVASPEAASVQKPESRRDWLVPELPSQVDHHELLALWRTQTAASRQAAARSGTRLIPIGVGGDDARPLDLDLELSPVTLVVGPPRSGRTTALRCIVAGLRTLNEPVLMVSMAGGGGSGPVICGRVPGAAARLAAALAEHPDATVLVDDNLAASALGDPAADAIGEVLAAHVTGRQAAEEFHQVQLPPGSPERWGPRAEILAEGAIRPKEGRLVIASSAPDVLTAYRGLLCLAKSARTGVLLGARGPGDGEVFGLRLGPRASGPPGRGLLVRPGDAVPVQIALPPAEPP
jgi:S-DNA-T family DNA segregation ATPase FtsK/SpoIIIE